jgi:hypothetical protein
VIDQEVEKVLRAAEERSLQVLTQHRSGLEAVAAALLEKETIDGAEVARLIDAAAGRVVHTTGPKAVASRFGRTAPATAGSARPMPAAPGYPAPAQAAAPRTRPVGPYDAERDAELTGEA